MGWRSRSLAAGSYCLEICAVCTYYYCAAAKTVRRENTKGTLTRKAAPEGAAKSSTAQCTNCRASATSTESPS